MESGATQEGGQTAAFLVRGYTSTRRCERTRGDRRRHDGGAQQQREQRAAGVRNGAEDGAAGDLAESVAPTDRGLPRSARRAERAGVAERPVKRSRGCGEAAIRPPRRRSTLRRYVGSDRGSYASAALACWAT